MTEAVVDVRVVFASTPTQAAFDAFFNIVKGRYPNKETRHDVRLTVKPGLQEQMADIKESGLLMRSGDGLAVLQCTPLGLTFSRLKPYTNWEAVMAEALDCWELFREHFSPIAVNRVSTRFINRIEIRGEGVDLDDYLTISPKVPEGLPQSIANFATGVVVPGVGPDSIANIRCAFDGAQPGPEVSVLLDVDIVKKCSLDSGDTAGIVAALNELRPIKNQAFFGSLTEKAVEIFL